MAQVEGLSLYTYRGCPFCSRVERAIHQLGIEVELRDTLSDANHSDMLLAATGRGTVPVLRIEEEGGEERWMPESADIIAYLQERFG
jgi:glutaredoxin